MCVLLCVCVFMCLFECSYSAVNLRIYEVVHKNCWIIWNKIMHMRMWPKFLWQFIFTSMKLPRQNCRLLKITFCANEKKYNDPPCISILCKWACRFLSSIIASLRHFCKIVLNICWTNYVYKNNANVHYYHKKIYLFF